MLTCIMAFGQNKSKDTINPNILIDPDIMAEYPGGTKACMTYIRDSVLSKINITEEESYSLRTAYSKITITESGKVTNVRIIRSSNVPRVDSLFKSALEKMPNWKPALINGKIQSQDFNFPLKIELK
ncbi:MAG: energy transducer TonB [Bacteroidetes bacterium]|nr:energy transducer TonB [Bacteroidota bacterium]